MSIFPVVPSTRFSTGVKDIQLTCGQQLPSFCAQRRQQSRQSGSSTHFNVQRINSQSRISYAVFTRLDGSLNKPVYKIFKTSASNLHVHVLRPGRVCSYEWKRNIRLRHAIQFALCLTNKKMHAKGKEINSMTSCKGP